MELGNKSYSQATAQLMVQAYTGRHLSPLIIQVTLMSSQIARYYMYNSQGSYCDYTYMDQALHR